MADNEPTLNRKTIEAALRLAAECAGFAEEAYQLVGTDVVAVAKEFLKISGLNIRTPTEQIYDRLLIALDEEMSDIVKCCRCGTTLQKKQCVTMVTSDSEMIYMMCQECFDSILKGFYTD